MEQDNVWKALLAWSRRVDYRDISDEAREWAETEARVSSLPEDSGEWKASLEIAFDAGRQWASLTSLRNK